MATVKLTEDALKQLDRLPKGIHDRVNAMLVRLEKWPTVSGVKQLSGNLSNWYRARVGDYRMIFQVESKKNENETETLLTVTVTKIGHRKDVYED